MNTSCPLSAAGLGVTPQDGDGMRNALAPPPRRMTWPTGRTLLQGRAYVPWYRTDVRRTWEQSQRGIGEFTPSFPQIVNPA